MRRPALLTQPTVAPYMAHQAVARDETVEVLQDRRWLGAAMLVAAFVFSLVIQSVGFIHSSWMLGDIAYHRGVALTMQGGSIQGEGPFAGLLSYYAGLYPLGLAIVSELVHRKFDAVLSAASWFGTLLMPAALAVLGTRFWPRNLFAIATFVAVGTLAVPWTTDWTALWVESVLPSGSSFWPVYPRDIALALVCVAIWAATASDRRIRTIGLGIVAGLCLLFHAQLTLLLAWFLLVYAGYRVYRERSVAPLLELAVAGVIGFVVAAWWLVPRMIALGVSGVLLISDHPSRIEFSPSLIDLFVALGSAGVLAILGVIGIVVTRTRGLGVTVPAIWVLAFVPLIILSRILPTFELFSERRLWLIASIGIIAFAAWAIILAARSRPTLLVVALISVTLVLPSVAGNLATVKRVNNAVDVAWRPGAAGLARQIDERPWIAAMTQLNSAVRARRGLTVLTYDSFAAWAWSFSGAQVESLWLPGPFKLGFDPAKLTGRSYLDRNSKLIAAFDAGPAGICAMAKADGIDTLLLTAKDGAVGLHDRTMAAPYRLDPVDRPSNPLEREVAPGTTYVDLNAQDRLRLSAGTSVTLPWVDPGVVSLGVLVAADATGGDILSVDSGSDVTGIPGRGTSGVGWEYFDVAGVDKVKLTATTPVELLEVVAFGPWPGKKQVPTNGPFVTTTANLCDAP